MPMSHPSDETLTIRPPLPVVCGLADGARSPGSHAGTCSRCGRRVSVNTRVDSMLIQAGIVRVLVCLHCWSCEDQAIVRTYRDTK
jgi:hypothetical protein